MTILFIWLVVAVIIMATCCYAIGRVLSEKEKDEIGPLLVMSAVGSIFWPIFLVASIVSAPFVIPYKLGVRRKNINKNKEKMWDTLKK